MKCLDIKIGISGADNKTFWKTIGTVFVSDNSVVTGTNDKPATFVIDYPKANGIIVERKKKEEADK